MKMACYGTEMHIFFSIFPLQKEEIKKNVPDYVITHGILSKPDLEKLLEDTKVCLPFIRELDQRRRRRQRQRRKTIALMSKNNRSARAFYLLVHFFASSANNNVKLPHLRFCGERERMTMNFSFSFFT